MSIASAVRRAFTFCIALATALAAPPRLRAQTSPIAVSFDSVRQVWSGHFEFRFKVKNVAPTMYLYMADTATCACATTITSSPSLSAWISPGSSQAFTVAVDIPSSRSGTYDLVFTAWAGQSPWPTEFNPTTGRRDWKYSNSFSLPISIAGGIPTVGPLITDYRPTVTPKDQNEVLPFGATITRKFAVANAGTQSATYALSATCSAYAYAGPCALTKTTTTLAPGAIDSIGLTVTTPSSVSSVLVTRLVATYTNAQGGQIADTASRNFTAPEAKPIISPKNRATLAVNGSQYVTFDVNGATPGAVSIIPLCTSWATSCYAYVPSYDPDDGSFFRVEVDFSTPSTPGNATTPGATVGLIARVMDGTQILYADTALMPLALGYAKPALTPKNPSETDAASQPRTYTVTLKNTGNLPSNYVMTPTCTGMTGCPSSTSVGLQPGTATTIQVPFTAPAAGQTGTVRFVARTITSPPEADTSTLTVTGGDALAPTIPSLGAPAENATITSGPLSIAFIVCDPDGTVSSPTATLNGSPITVNASTTTQSGCVTAKSGTLVGNATPGANTLSVSVSDGSHTTTKVVHFTYDEATAVQPIVTAVLASEVLRGGQQWADTFTIRNPGGVSATYAIGAVCTGGVSACSAAPASVTVGAGQTAKGWVTYTAPSSGSSATITLSASYAGVVRTSTGSAAVNLQFDQAAPSVIVTGLSANATISVLPTFSIAWCDADGVLATHAVSIDGVPLADSYASETRSGCASAATSNWTNQTVALGAHTLVATATDAVGHATTTTVPFTFALPSLADYQPIVTPRAPPVYLLPAEQTWAFAVRNAGTRSAPYAITAVCDPATTAGTCRVDHNTLTLAPGQTDTVRLTFSVAALPASPATFKVIASYQDQAGRAIADTGVTVAQIPSLAQLYQPQIGTDPTTHAQPTASVSAFSLPVTNLGIAPVTYQMSYAFTGGFSTRSWLMADTLHVGAGQTAYYMVQPVAPSTSGTHGTATITASYTSGGVTVSAASVLNLVTVAAAIPAAVAVSPRSMRRIVGANAVGIDTFTVTNTGSSATRYTYRVTCSGAASACSPSAIDSTPLLQGQQAFPVPVRYTGGPTPGTLGSIAFHAQVSGNASVFDDGVITDSVVAVSPLVVQTRGVTGGTTLERSQCLTIALGDAAAYECGDLRLVHTLPATTTMATTRAPSLVYNNRHQSGIIVVPAEVRVSGAPAGALLTATVTIKGQAPDSVRFNLSASQADGLPRRIAVPVNVRAKGLATGAYEYTFQVRGAVGGATYSSVVTDTMVVINRAATQFGPGWWLDGLEQLVAVDATHRLWIGGDGSTRIYTKRSDTTWLVVPNLDRVDSLTSNPSQTLWTRHLRNGASVQFNSAGQHVATTNALGHRTRFTYLPANQVLLDSIVLPVPAGAPIRAYKFTHDPTTGYLTRVDAPAPAGSLRRTSIGYTQPHGQWLLTSITDPDLTSISFGFDANDRVVSRTNRRGFATAYEYDEAQGVKRSRLMAGSDMVTRTFCAAETASLTACATGTIRSDSVQSWYDGPRTDVGDTTWFRLTRFGAPAVITDALHQVTTVEHGDTLWPFLVTRVVNPAGHEVRSAYDPARGLALVTTDVAPYGGDNAVTTYEWDAKWDAPTHVVMPTGGGSARTGYDVATGVKLWQEDGRGSATRVNFTYDAQTRQLRTVSTPGNAASAVNRVDYDTFGNTWKLTSPTGIVTESLKDAIGRDTLAKTPTDAAQSEARKLLQRFVYGAGGQDSITLQWNGADSMMVTKLYDAEGNLTDVIQHGAPDSGFVGSIHRRYVYDNADRKISERLFHGDANVEEEALVYRYDAAGNLITGGRDASDATITYDALNRMIVRNGTTYATYTYDSTGMRTADNTSAHISRSYYPNGALKTDTIRIASVNWQDFSAHVYGLGYTYDLAGHRTRVDHPWQLASSTTAQTSYEYDPVSGLLASVTDKFGQVFTYHYDAAGRLDQQVWRAESSPLTEVRSYDADSRLTRRTMRMADNSVVHDDSLLYDARDKVAKVFRLLEFGAQTDTFSFDVRGRTTVSYLSGTSEATTFDAYGNALQLNTKQGRPGVTWSTYERGSGRLMYRMQFAPFAGVDTTVYDTDLSGNQYHTLLMSARGQYHAPNGIDYTYLTLRTETQDTYGDRNRIFSHTVTLDTLFQRTTAYDPAAAEMGARRYVGADYYRYDALGRRIWVWSSKGATCNSSSGSPQKWTGCHSTLTRTVWDGDQILYEVRSDGTGDFDHLPAENDHPAGPHYGVVGYVHGFGIDEPLSLDKNNEIVIPYADWRGHFDGGVCGAVKCAESHIKFPQRNLFGAAHSVANAPAPSWYGSLIEGQEDASGYLYRRNRYFDPGTGRFTQEDPIGLGGGLNLYGFGGGDAVNNSDPFGLSDCPVPCAGTGTGALAGAAGAAGAASALVGATSDVNVVAAGIDAAIDWLKENQPKFVTYTRTSPNGQVYSGRTSGFGDPQSIVNARAKQHPERLKEFGPPVVDVWANGPQGYLSIRGREQQLIDANGRAQSEGGSSANIRRGVNKVVSPLFEAAATAMFGPPPPPRP